MFRNLYGILRRRTAPIRNRVRARFSPLPVQRSVPLRPQDQTTKRRRWHVLVDLINDHCPAQGVQIAEIGVRSGQTTAHLLTYCPQIELVIAVDLVAPPPGRDSISRLDKVRFLRGYSDACAKEVNDASLDLVFIDADHSEEWVRRDLEAWMPKLKAGGVMAGHDYGSRHFPGVKNAVDRYFSIAGLAVRKEANRVWWTRVPRL